MKKVIFCNNNLRGLLNFRGDVINSFEKEGYEIIIIIPKSTIINELYNTLPQSWKVYVLTYNPNSINPFSDFNLFRSLISIYKKEKPDLIFHYTIKPNIYGSLAAHICKIKNVAMVAGLGYMFDGNTWRQRLGRMLYKYGLRKADKVIALNRANYETLVSQGYVLHTNAVLFQGGEGVNLNKYPYKPMQFRETRFLMIARVLYDKGYNEFVEAAKLVKMKYPQIQFELLGPMSNDSPSKVPKEIIDRDVKDGVIKYLGVSNNVPSIVLRDGVVIVLISKYKEGLNRSLMEACAMGRPIITSSVSGCRETVDEGINGFIVNPDNPEQLADRMIKIIEMPPKHKQRMSQMSYEKAKNVFNVDNVIEQYKLLISEFYNNSRISI